MFKNVVKLWVSEEFSPLVLHRSKGQVALIIEQLTVITSCHTCLYLHRWMSPEVGGGAAGGSLSSPRSSSAVLVP